MTCDQIKLNQGEKNEATLEVSRGKKKTRKREKTMRE